MEEFLIGSVLLINAFAYGMMGVDKKRAQKGKRRIPEKKLWLIAIFGGASGMFLGMKKFRHKTKHTSFKVGVPILMGIHLFIFLFLYSIY